MICDDCMVQISDELVSFEGNGRGITRDTIAAM
jgi:hypothetical protein